MMDYEVIGAALAVVGVLLWIHRDLKADIRALNVRIDNILLADRRNQTSPLPLQRRGLAALDGPAALGSSGRIEAGSLVHR